MYFFRWVLVIAFMFGFTGCIEADKEGGAPAVDTIAPLFISASTVTVDENQRDILRLEATDSNPVHYSIHGGDADKMHVDSASGMVTFITAPDYESGKITYRFTATATDLSGNATEQEITVSIHNIPETVPTLEHLSVSVEENSTIGSVVGTIQVLEGGDSAITAFDLNDSTTFEINASGVIKTKVALDYETTTEYNLTVTATNSAGVSEEVNLSIEVINIIDTVPTLELFHQAIEENATIGTVVGRVSVLDAGDSAISAFDLNESTTFEINASGVIKTKVALDYETTRLYHLTVTATNEAGESNEVNVTIDIVDIIDTVATLDHFSSSVEENSTIGSVVGRITIVDSGDSAISAFDLNDSSVFDVNASGVISTSVELDYETTTAYNLTVTATNEAGVSHEVNVSIRIIDIPDVVPTIENFSVSIEENTTVATIVGQINVLSQGDTNISRFSLNNTADFEVNKSGVLKSKVEFDYETTKEYNLTVVAINDAGASDEVNITIRITDISDTVPTLLDTNLSVEENATADTVLGSVTVDSIGDSNITEYTLTGVGEGNFTIDNEGNITVSAEATLDYEVITLYNLKATAKNSAGWSDEVNVTIHITDIIDTVATLSEFNRSIEENVTIGTVVGEISVVDGGDSAISEFNLSDTTTFEVNGSGVIKTKVALDYETTTEYNLTVTATNGAGVSEEVNVTIHILDVADIVPTLEEFNTSIEENATVGTIVGAVTVVDAGDSAISAFDLNDTTTFEINASGVIKTKVALDYETTTEYNLTVTATNGAGESDEVNVTIHILNVADIVPTLEEFNTSIEENATVGTVLGSVTVVDAGDSAIHEFNLSDATTFEVNGSGVIKTKVALDYETTTEYNLTVTATNGAGVSDEVNVTIHIIDIADIVPTLHDTNLSVEENATADTVLGSVTVDSIGDSNITEYTLSGLGEGNFSIDNEGNITVSAEATLDYEQYPEYNLTAIAKNSAGWSDEVNITITVDDVSDIVPTLEEFNTSIEENTTIGSILGAVTVVDTGDSAIYEFNLSDATTFEINASGVIKTKVDLDYETTTEYTLTVTATNGAGVSDEVNVTIHITDIADVVPTLENFTASIEENSSIGSVVGVVSILDAGDSTITAFDLNESSAFDINASGTITTTVEFDYETKNQYELTVTATNGAGVSSEVNVTITITDVADIVPTLDNFTASIEENSTVGSIVGSISVTDRGDSNITAFTLSDESHFEINASGVLKTVSEFDYETTTEYNLTVTATNDAGESEEANITITIVDVADVVAVLEEFNASVEENVTIGSLVGYVSVADQGDSNITAFTLSSDTDFEINASGAITTKVELDYETTEEYTLTVTATNGAGVSDEANVTIHILNVVDTVPTLLETTLTVDENATADTLVGSVLVDSVGDSNITEYNLSGLGEGNFSIDSEGNITVSAEATLDYEVYKEYNLTAKAKNDSGWSEEVNLTIKLNNIAETAPVIAELNSSVDENATIGTRVDTIPVIDSGDTAITSFTLSGTGADSFDVSADGNVTIAQKLDYESVHEYNLTVYATNDFGDSNEVNVTIHVNDIYDPLLTIVGATYDTNRSAEEADDTLVLYFNKRVNTQSLDDSGEELGACFDLNGSGSIENGSSYLYEDNESHRMVISLATGSSFESGVTQITVTASDCIEDIDGISPDERVIESPLYVVATGLGATSYPDNNDTDRDDGHYHLGLVKETTRDGGNELVSEAVMRLEWQDDDNATTQELNQTDAITFCESMDKNGTGWRLPTITELQTIVDYAEAGETIDDEFVEKAGENYWSSTEDNTASDEAWLIDFGIAETFTKEKSDAYRVRCVREAP